MSDVVVERDTRFTEPIEFKEGRMAFPEADLAAEALRSHPGEAVAEFRFTGLSAGTIAESDEPLTFYRSGYRNAESDEPTGMVNIYASIKTEGEKGTFDTYVGHPKGAMPLPHGPHTLFTDTSIEAARSMDRLQTTLIVGNRACGAFGIGKALTELEDRRPPVHDSEGLRLAAWLQEAGFDWQPTRRREVKALEEAMGELRTAFVDRALVPLMVARLGFGGTFVTSNATGSRAPLFGFDHDALREELAGKVLSGQGFREHEVRSMDWSKGESARHGDFEAYVHTAIANVLTNQLGIKPTEVSEQ